MSGTWTTKADLPEAGYAMAVTVRDTIFVVIQDEVSYGPVLFTKLYAYDPRYDQFTFIKELTPRSGGGMVAVGKYLIILGGRNQSIPVKSIDIYDLQSGVLYTQEEFPDERSNCMVTIVNNRIYVMGGFEPGHGDHKLETVLTGYLLGISDVGSDETASLPVNYRLYQNHPNPFNAGTIIRYEIPQAAQVMVKVYNSTGQEIRTLVNEFQQPGHYRISWDGRDEQGRLVRSGIYIYQLRAGSFTQTHKMILMR